MANVKITELTALNAAETAATDVFPIVDVDADATKKISVSDLLRSAPDGTLSAPGFAFANDSNSGLYRIGTDNIALVTNGAARILIDATGNVTIPNTAIITSSEFGSGTAAAPSITFTNDTDAGIYSPGANQVAISTNGTGRLFVDASGNVGINTAPSARLHIIDTDSSSAYTTGAILGTQTSIYKQIVHTNQSSGTNEAGIVLRAGTSSNIAEWGLSAQRTGTTGGDLIFRTRTGASSSNEFVRITSAGLVGIGTSAPSSLLHLGGSSPDLTIQDSQSYTTSDGPLVQFQGRGPNAFNYNFGYIRGVSSGANNAGILQFATNSAGTQSVALTIDSSQRVGIGTTSPDSLLDVAGGNILLTEDTNVLWKNAARNANRGAIQFDSSGNLRVRYGSALTEGYRLDSSGRLLVGTTLTSADTRAIIQGRSSAADSTGRLYISSGNNAPGDGDGIAELYFSSNAHVASARIATQRDGGTWTAGSSLPTRLVFSTTADGASSPTERMTIDSNGVVKIAPANAAGDTPYVHVFDGASSQSVGYVASDYAGNEWHFGRNAANGYFYVVRQTGTGMYMNTNSWVATSDQRAKENIADIESTIDVVKSLKPSRFSWKSDGTADVGFIAQQVQPLIPEAVVDSGDPDAMLGITQDKLLPFVVKALQEAVAKIETLEAKVAALEAQ